MAAATVSLRPVEGQDLGSAFRKAAFLVRNTTAQIVRGISFRARRGGPTMLLDVAIPPGESLDGTIALPALLAQQTYDITLLRTPDAAAVNAPAEALAKLQE